MTSLQCVQQLDSQAAAVAVTSGPSCFDAVQAGTSLWVAVKAADRSVHVVHAPRSSLQAAGQSSRASGGGGSGSLHCVLRLPEPVAAVQLGVPTAGAPQAAGAAAGTAVLLAVGHSCRVWAFQLHPAASAGPAAPVEVHADNAAAALVPVVQQQCPASAQLAAAVAWEHLAYAWDRAAAAAAPQPPAGSKGGRIRSTERGSSAAVVPLSLAGLQATLQQQVSGAGQQKAADEQAPLLVHTVANWVCRPQASAGIPADATAVAYCGSAAAAAEGHQPRLTCSTRYELAASSPSNGTAGGPIGHLLVATAGGQLLALPVGTPCSEQIKQAASASQQPAAVCFSSSSVCFLHTTSCHASQQPEQLLLLAEAGQLVPAAAGQSAGSTAVTVAASRGSGSGATCGPLPFQAVQLIGAQAAAAAGSSLFYVPSSSTSTIRHIEAGSGLQAGAAAVAFDVGAHSIGLLVSAGPTAGSSLSAQPLLVLLTTRGELLAAAPAGSAAGAQRGTDGASVRQLERGMQDLLGSIAHLSERQEELQRQLAQLDGSIAGLAAAIPAAHGAATRSGVGLECHLHPLALRAAGSGGGGSHALLLELRLRNRGSAPLAGSWSLLLCHSVRGSSAGSSCSAGSGSVWAAQLGGLPAGAAWSRQYELTLPASGHGLAAGQLRVLLCRHGGSIAASSVLLLHAAQLDALHLLHLGADSGAASGKQRQQEAEGSLPQALLQLQLPAATHGLQPPAEVFKELRQQGLSALQLPLVRSQQAAQLPGPAFRLLQPAGAQLPVSDFSGRAPGTGLIAVQARLLPAVPSAAGQQELLQVVTAAPDTAAALACHQGLCRRAVQLQAATAAAHAPPQQQAPWPRMPGGDALLLPAAFAGAPAHFESATVGAVDEAALEQALLQLRQLRGMAMALRHPGGAGAEHCPADDQQQRAAAWHAEAQRLALAARHALAAVPVLMC